jgi:ComF family protein
MMPHFAARILNAARTVFAILHETILAFIAPNVCARCKTMLEHESVLCASCNLRLQKVATHSLVITKQYSVTVFAAAAYNDIVQELIHAKLQRRIYAARLLGILIWEHTDLCNQQFDYIVPVPLHWQRYTQRGYNQADEIARALSARSGKPVLHCLHRVRATVTQAGLSAQERDKNVDDAFEVKERYVSMVRNARILLVDDVLTTGSTMRSCVRALRMKRPLSITAAVAARVV